VTDVTRLLAEEAEAWRLLDEAFRQIPEDRFEEPTLTAEGWSPKDAMFHVAGWMGDCGRQLERMRDGSFDPDEETGETIERQNEAWFEASRTMAPGDVRERFTASRRHMVQAFGELGSRSATPMPEAAEWFEESGALHYAKHVDDLRAFVEGAA
jgi:hypothetical protein